MYGNVPGLFSPYKIGLDAPGYSKVWARSRRSDAVTSGCHYVTKQRHRPIIWRPPLARVLVGCLEIAFPTYGSLKEAGYVKYLYETINSYMVLPAAVW